MMDYQTARQRVEQMDKNSRNLFTGYALCMFLDIFWCKLIMKNLSFLSGIRTSTDNSMRNTAKKYGIFNEYYFIDPTVRHYLCLSASKENLREARSAIAQGYNNSDSLLCIHLLDLYLNVPDPALNLRLNEEIHMRRRDVYKDCDFGASWLDSRTDGIKSLLLGDQLHYLLHQGMPASSLSFINQYEHGLLPLDIQHAGDITLFYLLADDRERYAEHLAKISLEHQQLIVQGVEDLIFCRPDKAVQKLTTARRILRKIKNSTVWSLPDIYDMALQLARFCTGDARQDELLQNDIKRKFSSRYYNRDSLGLMALSYLQNLRSGSSKEKIRNQFEANYYSRQGYKTDFWDPLSGIMYAAVGMRLDCDKANDITDKSFGPVRGIFPLLEAMLPTAFKHDDAAMRPERATVLDLTQLVPERPLWQIRLDQIEDLLYRKEKNADTQAKRLAWYLNVHTLDIEPYEQTLNKSGNWSSGKKISVKRLKEEAATLPWLQPQDRSIAAAIEQDYYSWNNAAADAEAALPFLVGHPLLFDSKTKASIHIKKGELQLEIKESGQDCVINLPHLKADASFLLEKTGESEYVYKPVSPAIRRLHGIIDGKLTFPKDQMPRVLEMLGKSKIAVHIDIKAKKIDGNTLPVLQMRQRGSAFGVDMVIRPGGANSQAVKPGIGAAELIVINELKQPCKVRRNLKGEEDAVNSLINACPILAERIQDDYAELEDAETALAFLEALKDCGKPFALEWPDGEKLKLAGYVSASAVHISLRKRNDWFAISGDVTVNEELTVSIEHLLAASASSPSRFVRLDDGSFAALTQELKRKLDRINAIAVDERGKRHIHPLAASCLEDEIDGMDVQSDDAWQELLQKLQQARTLEPSISPLLQADLRPYQIEGVQWMLKLSAMSVGACLADDMGLGKTVQTIAVMLDRASQGPCIVVAPTSVCFNWQLELARFAPTLEVLRPGSISTRKETIKGMQAGQVLIISYSLLHIEQDALAQQQWSMVVFDEAQALKNAFTKRAKAGSSLNAGFRVALTGTPIENHIEDIWSLFNAILPGLLGSQDGFKKRFGSSRAGSASIQALRRIIRPFILRRIKSHVLEDLPGKTEQTIVIEPSPKEKAFYEALRRRAKQNVAGLQKDAPGRRMHILAELTHLRRACCHPTLADPQAVPIFGSSGSKIERLLELAGELKQGGHRLLIFSQFVGYLTLIKSAMDKNGFSSLYIDGSTPEKERAKTVQDFQRGQADAFLISLRAGGQGLNLTAADYVIHMDPWWNPAVEDQASDRAYRIGQKRPVTIYRMVMAGSVEEKILDLHKEKKELAASFLEGTEEATLSLSEEELLLLME